MFSKSMRVWFGLALASGLLQAAAIRGTVSEGQTGRPLARASVTLEPVAGTSGRAQSAHTDPYGAFEFSNLPGGAYVVTASRRGFAPVNYGQKRWKAAGAPVMLRADESRSLSFQLPRFGSIAGTVLDENEVGLPDHDVVAYRASRPPKLVARARSDERGRYRIFGLEPGRYLVRTVAREFAGSGYLPTFYRESQRAGDAMAVEVALDQQVDDITIHPAPGRLAAVSGRVDPPGGVEVTLVSDTGAETVAADASGHFRFNPQAPGMYELYAQASAERRSGEVRAIYQTLFLNRDRDDIRLDLQSLPQVQFILKDTQGRTVDYHDVLVMARRKDLSGIGKTQALELSGERLAFLPGRWDLALIPPRGYFVEALTGAMPPRDNRRADGWNEVMLSNLPTVLQYVLSAAPGGVHGTVTGPRQEPVPGAPVYLEAYDPQSQRRLKDVEVTRTDSHGQYHFSDLAPGDYRLLSSFDWEAPDGPLDLPGTRSLRVPEARDLPENLVLSDSR